MKTTINKDFFEKWKDKNVVMLCKKKEYAEEFCRLLEKFGTNWYKGKSSTNDDYWNICTDGSCYEFNKGGYDVALWYEKQDYTILDFEDFLVKE